MSAPISVEPPVKQLHKPVDIPSGLHQTRREPLPLMHSRSQKGYAAVRKILRARAGVFPYLPALRTQSVFALQKHILPAKCLIIILIRIYARVEQPGLTE